MRACMYVCTPIKLLTTYYPREMKHEKPVKQVILLSGFYVRTYIPTVDIANKHGHSKQEHHELLSRNTKVRLH